MSPHPDAGALLKLAEEIEHNAKTAAPLDEASFLLRNKLKFASALRQAASQGSAGGERGGVRSASAWQTVPLPATSEMTAAGERIDAEMRAQGFANAETEAIYYAMLDAAPQPPALSPPVKTAELPGIAFDETEEQYIARLEAEIARLGGAAQAQPEPVAAALARRLCQMFDNGGESQRSARARHASVIFQILNRETLEYAVEQAKCDADPVGYLRAAEGVAIPSADREAGK